MGDVPGPGCPGGKFPWSRVPLEPWAPRRKDDGMTAMTDVRPIFENQEWLVSEDGLEHKTTGYFIERESLGQRREDGLWTWPLHMAEKQWCALTPFAEAF